MKKKGANNSTDEEKVVITIECTVEERDKLKQKSEWNDQSVSEYILQKGLKSRNRKVKKDRERAAAMMDLQQILNDVRFEAEEGNTDNVSIHQVCRIQKGIDRLWGI